MPTLSRYHQLKDNIAYHVINRGNRKLEIFHDEQDYNSFKDIVSRHVLRKELIIYHYSLMPNHYHLEVELERPENISSVMSGINRAYTHYYHKKYRTAGYLWQGRFISKPIEKDVYLMYCGGYIEMNAVRAKIVERPEEYKYSSVRYYILGEMDDLITENPIYADFGITLGDRQKKYRVYLLEMDQDKVLEKLSADIIGSKEFINKLCRKDGRLVPRRQGKPVIRL